MSNVLVVDVGTQSMRGIIFDDNGNLLAKKQIKYPSPAAKQLSGKSFVTTLPAAITQPFPIVTPGITDTFAPNQQLSPILIGRAFSSPLFRLV